MALTALLGVSATSTEAAPPPFAAVVVRGAGETDDGAPHGLSVELSCFVTALLDPGWADRAINADAWTKRLGATVDELKIRFGDGALPRFESFPVEVQKRVGAGQLALVVAWSDPSEGLSVERYLSTESRRLNVTPSDVSAHLDVDVDTPSDSEESGLAAGVGLLLRSRLKVSRVALRAADGARLAGDLSVAVSRARVLDYHRDSDPGPPRILAQCHSVRGRIEEAIAAWTEAVRRAPENGVLRFQYAEMLAVDAQPVEATTEYTEAMRLLSLPGDPFVIRARRAIDELENARRLEEERRAAWDLARKAVDDARGKPASEDSRRAAEDERLAVLEERLRATPGDEAAWIELAELLVGRRVYSNAIRRLREGLAALPKSVGIRQALARTLLLDRRLDEVSIVLSSVKEQERTADVWVLLGDVAMDRAGPLMTRWTDVAGDNVPIHFSHYLRGWRPKSGVSAAYFAEAIAAYRRAVDRAPNDGRARARILDARTLLGEAKQVVADLETIDPMSYPDLLRVFACALVKSDEVFRGHEMFDRFLQRVVTKPDRVVRVVEMRLRRAEEELGSGSDEAAVVLERAERLLDSALVSAPSHARLHWLRGRTLAARGKPAAEDALAELRYAFVAGEEAYRKLEKLWANPPRGPRTQRPPETPTAQAAPGRGTSLTWAPRTLSDFLRLRMEIAGLLLSIEPRQALTELRHAEYFLRKEEIRLRSSRTQVGAAESLVKEWTRPAKWQDEPVDFGNARHRLQWARLRTLIADVHQALGEHEAAERAYRWAARAVAVRKGTVIPESEWVAKLSVAERRVTKRALVGFAAMKTKRGEKDVGNVIRRWAKQF